MICPWWKRENLILSLRPYSTLWIPIGLLHLEIIYPIHINYQCLRRQHALTANSPSCNCCTAVLIFFSARHAEQVSFSACLLHFYDTSLTWQELQTFTLTNYSVQHKLTSSPLLRFQFPRPVMLPLLRTGCKHIRKLCFTALSPLASLLDHYLISNLFKFFIRAAFKCSICSFL